MSNTQLVKVEKLSASAIDALNREVEDFGVDQPLLPFKPFEIRGAITYLDWCEWPEDRKPQQPPESAGLKFTIRVDEIREGEFTSSKGVVMPPMLKVGNEYPCIYFAQHPNMKFALEEQAKFRKRLFAAIAPGAAPATVLQQLRGQSIDIPMAFTRTYVRTTKGSASNPKGTDLFEDSFEFLGAR